MRICITRSCNSDVCRSIMAVISLSSWLAYFDAICSRLIFAIANSSTRFCNACIFSILIRIDGLTLPATAPSAVTVGSSTSSFFSAGIFFSFLCNAVKSSFTVFPVATLSTSVSSPSRDSSRRSTVPSPGSPPFLRRSSTFSISCDSSSISGNPIVAAMLFSVCTARNVSFNASVLSDSFSNVSKFLLMHCRCSLDSSTNSSLYCDTSTINLL